jgi:hypothetical protein
MVIEPKAIKQRALRRLPTHHVMTSPAAMPQGITPSSPSQAGVFQQSRAVLTPC